ncbi:MAG: hypothetical protein K2H76_09390, partial [Muribaculaceae bacterium]|nr:hypothetical protein [Muribaculaceae bacterium]
RDAAESDEIMSSIFNRMESNLAMETGKLAIIESDYNSEIGKLSNSDNDNNKETYKEQYHEQTPL